MDSCEFGNLLTALRKQNLNENGERWTREDLCEYVHLSPHQLGRLERGDRKYLDTETLQLLAEAFNLTTLERKELFYAAVGVAEEKLINPLDEGYEDILNDLISTLKNMHVPAFVLDDYADILAANELMLNFYQVDPDYISKASETFAGFNLLKFIYSPDSGYAEVVGSSWPNMAIKNLHFFRRVTLRKRQKTYFKKLLRELCKEKLFDIDWHDLSRGPSLSDSVYDTFQWNHPCHGPVNLIFTESLVPTKHGNLYLFTYVPGDISTSTVLFNIAEEAGGKVYLLAPWPDKPLNSSS